jgi:hypothetical protein
MACKKKVGVKNYNIILTPTCLRIFSLEVISYSRMSCLNCICYSDVAGELYNVMP